MGTRVSRHDASLYLFDMRPYRWSLSWPTAWASRCPGSRMSSAMWQKYTAVLRSANVAVPSARAFRARDTTFAAFTRTFAGSCVIASANSATGPSSAREKFASMMPLRPWMKAGSVFVYATMSVRGFILGGPVSSLDVSIKNSVLFTDPRTLNVTGFFSILSWNNQPTDQSSPTRPSRDIRLFLGKTSVQKKPPKKVSTTFRWVKFSLTSPKFPKLVDSREGLVFWWFLVRC